MVRFETRIVILRPIAEVFEFATRFENIPHWVLGVPKGEQTSEGPMRVGTTGREWWPRLSLRGIAKNWQLVPMTLILGTPTFDLRGYRSWVITEYEPNQKCVFRSSTWRLISTVGFHFQPAEGGTELTCLDEHQLHGPFKLVEPTLARKFPKGRAFLLGNVKRVLETRAQGSDQAPAQE